MSAFRPARASRGAWKRGSAAVLALTALVSLAACSSSPKPAYCSDRTNLQSSINGLKNFSLSDGVAGLQSQLTRIQDDANSLVSSAKSDFPDQTSAISSSIDALKADISSLPSSPSASDLATVASDASNVVTAVNSFMDATKSKCS